MKRRYNAAYLHSIKTFNDILSQLHRDVIDFFTLPELRRAWKKAHKNKSNRLQLHNGKLTTSIRIG